MTDNYFEQFFEYINNGTSPFHVVSESVEMLEKKGFQRLELQQPWGIEAGGKYYVNHHGSTLFAFTIGSRHAYGQQLRIAASHGDFPCLRIKTHPEMDEEGYRKLNVEVYGGAILNTWLDRPLSVAGRVALRSEDAFKPQIRYVDMRRPVMTIPNLAIHINREVNKGVELNRQTDMPPVCAVELDKEQREKTKEFFMGYLAKELDVAKEDILDYELSVYNTDTPAFVGLDEQFISAPRLDNLTSSFALIQSMITCEREQGVNMAVIFDHEEIGSRTKQGVASVLMSWVLEKLYASLGMERAMYIETLSDSLLLSVDVSHGLHPNYAGKNDVTNKPVLGGGICLKEACSQSYATDCEAVAIVQQLCERSKASYQKAVNRSDGTGGSTLGAIAGAQIPTNIVDMGVPLLAMHSARELMGREDQLSMQRLLDEFYTNSPL